MKTGILYTTLLCVASAGFIGWRVYVLKNRETPHFELVEDRSLSHSQGCESLVGLAQKALSVNDIPPGSTLSVLVIGSEATADEPLQLGTYSIPTTRKVLEGRTANSRRQREVLQDILNKCQAVRRTTVSPIFLGVKQAIADLRARGCGETSHCQVLVDSDLEENVETSIKEGLNRARNTKLLLPSPLDNQCIEVSFCGLAVTAGRLVNPSRREIQRVLPRDPGREDRLLQVWRSLFTHPELVRFEPYCPQRRD